MSPFRPLRSTLTFSWLILIFILLVSPSAGEENNYYHPGRVIIRAENDFQPAIGSLFPDVPFRDAKFLDDWKVKPLVRYGKATATTDLTEAPESPLHNLYILDFPETVSVPVVLSQLRSHPGIRYAEPDYRLELYSWPQDSLFPYQWYLHNTGQEFYAVERIPGYNNDILFMRTGVPGEDVNLSPIYDNPPADSAPVIVAIVDTGIDYDHPDLAANIYNNPMEIPDNGLDDDHNGFIDDYRGWDFSGDSSTVTEDISDNDATDAVGHGTHVAGLVAAVENEIGIAGYPGRIKIMPLKIFPNGFLSIAIPALYYSADMGARVVNNSWGLPFESVILQEALAYVVDRGTLPVAAAGNFGNSERTFPAAYPETYTVGGTNANGHMTYFSTYGPFLDISAPAQDILSLRADTLDLYASSEPGLRIIGDHYLLADGTSMAAPLTAGAAALLFSYNPGLTQARVREILNQSADDLLDPFNDGRNLPGYDSLSGWGRLNVGAAVSMILEPSAYFSSPFDNDVVFDTAVFGLATTGGYTGPVDLYFGEGTGENGWELIYHADNVTASDSFFVWPVGDQTGYYTFRQVSDYGESRLALRLISGEEVMITFPDEGMQLSHFVEISGSVFGPDLDSLQIRVRQSESANYENIFSGTAYYFDEVITGWPLTSLPGGDYYIRLDAFMGDRIITDSVQVYVKSLLRDGFPMKLGQFASFSPAVGDLTGDGISEIIAGSYDGLYAIDAEANIMPGFPVEPGRDMRSMPALDDIDGDGLNDIIACGKDILGCYNYLGQALSGWPKEASTGMTFFSYPVPTVTELFDKSDSVILYMTRFGEVHANKYNGDSYFYSLGGLFTALDPNIFDTSQFAGVWVPFVTGFDVDDNGINEVGAIYSTVADPAGFYLWDGRNGLPPFDWQKPLALEARQTNGGMIADVDGDDVLDVVMAGLDEDNNALLWVARRGYDILPGWPVRLEGVEDWLGTAPVCADIDGDNEQEIMVAYSGYDIARIFVFNADGTPYVENPGDAPGVLLTVASMLGNLIVADIDGDGTPNLIARGGYLLPGTGYERIFAWEPNGNPAPGYPVVTSTPRDRVISTPFTPVVTDLEDDGMTELIMCGGGGDLFVWDLEVPYHSDQALWPKYLGDAKNTGVKSDDGIPTGTDPEGGPVPNRFAIESIYPNPFNPETTVSFTLDRDREVRLEVFNILGQKVKNIMTGELTAGAHEARWDGTDSNGRRVASGIYMARLIDEEGRSETRKMVLVK